MAAKQKQQQIRPPQGSTGALTMHAYMYTSGYECVNTDTGTESNKDWQMFWYDCIPLFHHQSHWSGPQSHRLFPWSAAWCRFLTKYWTRNTSYLLHTLYRNTKDKETRKICLWKVESTCCLFTMKNCKSKVPECLNLTFHNPFINLSCLWSLILYYPSLLNLKMYIYFVFLKLTHNPNTCTAIFFWQKKSKNCT